MKSFAPEVVTYTPPRVEVQTLQTEQGFAASGASLTIDGNFFGGTEIPWT